MSWEWILSLVGIVVGAQAVWTFITFLITRGDNKKEKEDEKKQDIEAIKNNTNELLSRMDVLEDKVDSHDDILGTLDSKVTRMDNAQQESKAATARIQILRFADELSEGKDFVKGHYDDIYEAINIYNKYVSTHKDFINEQTADAQAFIRRKYEEHQMNGTFKTFE